MQSVLVLVVAATLVLPSPSTTQPVDVHALQDVSSPLPARAPDLALRLAPQLMRPIVSNLDRGHGEAWIQYDRFQPSFDVFDYGDHAGSSTQLSDAEATRLGARVALTRRLSLRLERGFLESDLERQVVPFNIVSSQREDEVRLQQVLLDRPPLRLALEAGYRRHQTEPVSFFQYQFSEYKVTSLTADPLFTVSGDDDATVVGLRAFWSRFRRWHAHFGAERRFVDVAATLDSRLFTDPFLGPLIAAEAPQAAPWKETHDVFTLGLEHRHNRHFTTAADFTLYDISRDGYVPRAGKPDYASNRQLDLWTFWQFRPDWNFFVHGRAYTNFVLGDQPAAYNQRTNHRFGDAYGYLSFGVTRAF